MNQPHKKPPKAQATQQQVKPAVAQPKKAVSAQSGKRSVAPPVYKPQLKPAAVQQKPAHPTSIKTHPAAPPVYRPQPAPKVLQTKAASTAQAAHASRRAPVAPAVYRPQPQPKVLQTKRADAQPQAGNSTRRPVAPPVYKPQAKQSVQPKLPQAPPVYRPQSAKSVQRKEAGVQVKAQPNTGKVVVRPIAGRPVVQRYLDVSQLDDVIVPNTANLKTNLKTVIDRYNKQEDKVQPDYFGTVSAPQSWFDAQIADLKNVETQINTSLNAEAEYNRTILNRIKDGVLREKALLAKHYQKWATYVDDKWFTQHGLSQANAKSAIEQDEIDALVAQHPQIIITVGLNVATSRLLGFIKSYLAGTLTLYRGIQQWHHCFPKDVGYKDVIPKKNNNAAPDFADNDNSWLPFSDDFNTAALCACSVGSIFKEYWRQGKINEEKALGVIFRKRVEVNRGIAFGFDGEIQIKGPCRADSVNAIFLDDDLGAFVPNFAGLTFKKLLGAKS